KKIVKQNPDDGEALYRLANAYRLNGELQKAEIWFKEAVRYNNVPLCKLYYAQVLLSNNKYAESEEWFLKYAASAENSYDAINAKRLAQYAQNLGKNGIEYRPFTIQKVPFNSPELDFSPMYYRDDKIVFASNRKFEKKRLNRKDEWTHENFVDLYYTQKNGENIYDEPILFSENVKSKFHEGPTAFTHSYDTMYFTRSDYDKKGGRGFDKNRNTRLKIYQVVLEGETWGEVVSLPFNDNEFSSCHPALSTDGKTMIFASDRPGGYGHMDLYITHLQNGEWSLPENLGTEINTSGNELFPFLHKDGTLYFASDMKVGIGGLDIFKASFNGSKWFNTINLGAPINSSKDDFGFIINQTNIDGYFTSNRSGNGDDIYHFKLDNTIQLEGIVINCNTGEIITGSMVNLSTNETIVDSKFSDEEGRFYFNVPFDQDFLVSASKEGYTICGDCNGEEFVTTRNSKDGNVIQVELPICVENEANSNKGINICGVVMNEKYNKPLPKAKVILTNMCTGEDIEVYSDNSGKFRLPAEKGCDYVLLGSKEKFSSKMDMVSSEKINDECNPVTLNLNFDESLLPPSLHSNLELTEGMVLELHHIYFDLDKYAIRYDAAPDLDTLYNLLIKYPDMEGEISAHTDSRASHEYNFRLSENRAKAARNYLISKGIHPSRLTTQGYGELRLKNGCTDGISCSEKQHQRNRRVEFKVTYLNSILESKEYEYFIR
ncbi:MAG: OmpA family protein, partial [Bacteroidota bacterium]